MQVLKECVALTSFSDGKHFVHGWRNDLVPAVPKVLRMAVDQVGIAPFDAEPLKRQYIFPERLCTTEPGVKFVDLLDGNMTATNHALNCRICCGQYLSVRLELMRPGRTTEDENKFSGLVRGNGSDGDTSIRWMAVA